MNKHLTMSFAACAGLLLLPMASGALPVEYVKVCRLYGEQFHYIPGTDICRDETSGDVRVQTEGGTWRSMLPYPDGNWVTSLQKECSHGRIVPLGTFSSSDFSDNAWGRKQTRAIPVPVGRGEFVSKVIMSGGFSDPRLSPRHGVNSDDGLCVRSAHPGLMEDIGNGYMTNPPFGNSMVPIGCVSNSRILNMPAAYAISATSAYPSVDSHFTGPTSVGGPYTYGTHLVVTTDFGSREFQQLNYYDSSVTSLRPLAGNVSVSVCVQSGSRR